VTGGGIIPELIPSWTKEHLLPDLKTVLTRLLSQTAMMLQPGTALIIQRRQAIERDNSKLRMMSDSPASYPYIYLLGENRG
jgi:hypothetical protein